jgi:hypothetical protein
MLTALILVCSLATVSNLGDCTRASDGARLAAARLNPSGCFRLAGVAQCPWALTCHLTLETIASREKPIANQPIERACPRLIGITAHVCAHGCNGCSRRCVSNVDVHVQDQIRNFLHSTGDREFGSYMSGQPCIAATAGLQVACLCLACDWREIGERKLARISE